MADPGFPRRGRRQPQRGAPIYYLAFFFAKNCMKIKEEFTLNTANNVNLLLLEPVFWKKIRYLFSWFVKDLNGYDTGRLMFILQTICLFLLLRRKYTFIFSAGSTIYGKEVTNPCRFIYWMPHFFSVIETVRWIVIGQSETNHILILTFLLISVCFLRWACFFWRFYFSLPSKCLLKRNRTNIRKIVDRMPKMNFS